MTLAATQIHPPGHIDIHKRSRHLSRALHRLETEYYPDLLDDNRRLILTFIRDCRLGKTVIGKSKRRIGDARCLKYIHILRQLSGWFAKPFTSVTQDDMEAFVERLESGRILSYKGIAFSEATKADIKKTIKKFWKWKDGNNRQYPPLVEWIETIEPVKAIPALTKDQIECLIEYTADPRNKALIRVLFDSGARIEELLNVRLGDDHLTFRDDLDCYQIRLEFSKTLPRTISLPLSTKELRRWLERHPEKGNSEAQLFPLSYGNTRTILHRIGKRALGRSVNPHLFRHSSATYYANLLNRYQLCYRYGWAMSSDMVDRYLDRAGVLEERTSEIVRRDEAQRESSSTEALQEELTLLREAHRELTRELTELKAGKNPSPMSFGASGPSRTGGLRREWM